MKRVALNRENPFYDSEVGAMSPKFPRGMLSILSLVAILWSSAAHAECAKDGDCSGDALCSAGRCVVPGGPSLGPASAGGNPATSTASQPMGPMSSAGASASGAPAAAATACFPQCRSGYLCHMGQCVSACNPRCEQGQQCNGRGECVAAGARGGQASASPAREVQSPDSGWKAAPAGFGNYGIGVATGLLFPGPGEVSIDGSRPEMAVGNYTNVYADMIVAPRFSMGLSLGFAMMPFANSDSSLYLVSPGVVMKTRISMGDRFQLRPGLVVGFNAMFLDDHEDVSRGFNLGLNIDAAVKIKKGLGVLGQFGFISQPDGGTDSVSLSFPPIMYLTAGVEFGD